MTTGRINQISIVYFVFAVDAFLERTPKRCSTKDCDLLLVLCVCFCGFKKKPSEHEVRTLTHDACGPDPRYPSDISFLTSFGELNIGPQSVSLIRCPISSQPSFAFCTGAIGDALSVR